MFCSICTKDVHPVKDLLASGAVADVCPTCQCVLGDARKGANLPAPDAQHPGPAGEMGGSHTGSPAASRSTPRATPPGPTDLVAEARAQLAAIDAELARLADLQRQRRRLAAMVAAAEAEDEAAPGPVSPITGAAGRVVGHLEDGTPVLTSTIIADAAE